ncbi:ATP-dependent DNA helicase RecG [Patescibacteria group bacterium]|nr:ATP-dependent DNA helicase RecG [Patescibacteria group bacterium]
MDLTTPITALSGLNRQHKAALEFMGLKTFRDLLFHYPFRYDDYSTRITLSQVEPGTEVTLIAQVTNITSRKGFRRRRLNITEATLSDETGTIKATWFNQPYLTKYLQVGETYRFAGKLLQTKYGLRLQNPIYGRELAEMSTVNPFMPVYPSSSGLSQFVLRRLIKQVLPLAADLAEHLPVNILDDFDLLGLSDALHSIHFPAIEQEYLTARRRLAFDELLRLQLSIGQMRQYRLNRLASVVSFDEKKVRSFVRSLPFELTDDQRRAAWEIIRDMEKGVPMNRLLDGDVGSGKTAVAAVAAANVAAAGYQTALMAPTEILALQHYHTLCEQYGSRGPKIVLWTSAYRRSWSSGKDVEHKGQADIERLRRSIAQGRVGLVIGTHALVEREVTFKSLALVVIDEQHRFGVRTRRLLCQKGVAEGLEPHLLSMTATPIPRSLALTVYGDLDLSLLKEKPKGRQNIITKVVSARGKKQAYEAIRKELVAGRQVFVVCPLIDKSDMLGVTSVTEEFERLHIEVFPEYKMAMLHGRLTAKEKEATMQSFKDGICQILVSTSVIEVGVDVPNATVMCVEGADRFGLAQLHQFRGRVGRGVHQSYCYLFPVTYGSAVRERLRAMEATDDGFALAEKDLRLRGPGDLLGEEQSGYFSALRLASMADLGLVRDARTVAQRLLAEDPDLSQHSALREFVGTAVCAAHLE